MTTATAEHPRAVVNIAQAADICGVCRRTVYNWLKAGKVPYLRTPGGSVRIHRDALLRLDAEVGPFVGDAVQGG